MAPTKTTRAGSFIKSKKASFTKLLFDPVAPRQPIIDPWLDRGSSALIWGPTGVGKSYFAQTLALMVATGGRLPNLGWSAGGEKPLKVLWFDGEQGIRTAQTRAREMIRLKNEPSPIQVPPDVAEVLAIKGVEEFLDYRSKVFGGRGLP